MVSASAAVLSGRYRTTRANRSATPPGYLELACTPSKAISATSSGRTRTTPCGRRPPRPARHRRVGELKQPRGLPGQHLVGQALERLAQHDQAAGDRVARAEVQVGQPAAAPPVAPLGGQHDQVESVPRLYLDPLAAPAAGRVAAVQRLDHDALMAAGDGVTEEFRGRDRIRRDDARDHQRVRQDPGQQRMPLAAGRVDQVGAVEVQEIEEERGQRQVRLLLPGGVVAGRTARGDLEGPGAPVREQGHRFAVEHRGRRAEAEHGMRRSRGPGR